MRLAVSLLLTIVAGASGALAAEPSKLWAQLSMPKTTVRTIFDARATAVITNTGRESAKINTITLGSPPLALKVFNSRGLPVPTLPPPNPPADLSKYDVTLAPGQSRTFSYELAALFNTDLAQGNYVVRMDGIKCNDIVMTISKKKSSTKIASKASKRSVKAVIRKRF